jgi:hypothetical protein
MVPAATPSTNTHGSAAENRRRQGDFVKGDLVKAGLPNGDRLDVL